MTKNCILKNYFYCFDIELNINKKLRKQNIKFPLYNHIETHVGEGVCTFSIKYLLFYLIYRVN